MSEEINCEYTSEPVCPFCGAIIEYIPYGDGETFSDGNYEEMECPKCKKEFDVRINIERTFTTEKPEETK